MRYALDIGWRQMTSRKTQSVSLITSVAVSGVALGVAALLAVIAITTGFQNEFERKVLGVNAHVLALKYGDFEEYRDVVDQALAQPEVVGAGPFLIQPMMLVNGDRIAGVLLKGVDPDRVAGVLDLPTQLVEGTMEGLRADGAAPAERRDRGGELLEGFLARVEDRRLAGDTELPPDLRATLREQLVARTSAVDAGAAGEITPLPVVHVPTPEDAMRALEGESFATGDDSSLRAEETTTPTHRLPGILVGRALAARLELRVGTRVRMVSPTAVFERATQGSATAATPRSRELRVVGIFEAGFDEYDNELAVADLYEAQQFSDRGDSVDGVEIRLADPALAPIVARRLERQLGGGAYHTMDWQQLNRNLFVALETQKQLLSFVFATIVFVAAFVVVATLIMVVLERKREIAILKAMGAKDAAVLSVFVTQGLAIGLMGTAIGAIVGGGVCAYLERIRFPLDPHVYLIDHLPVSLGLDELITTVVVAIVICFLATLIPSWWAARMVPAEGVRAD